MQRPVGNKLAWVGQWRFNLVQSSTFCAQLHCT